MATLACCVTGVPFEIGEAAYVVVLEQRTDHSRLGATAMWKPVATPIKAVILEEDQLALDPVMAYAVAEGVKARLIETIYEGTAIKASTFSPEIMFNTIRDGMLKVKSSNNQAVLVDIACISERVVHAILKDWYAEIPTGDDRFCELSAVLLQDDIPKFLATVKQHFATKGMDNVVSLSKMTDTDLGKMLNVPYSMHSRIVSPLSLVGGALLREADDIATKITKAWLTGVILNKFMTSVGRVWIPSTYHGDFDPHGYSIIKTVF